MEPEPFPAEMTPGDQSQSLPECPDPANLEAGRADLRRIEAMVAQARAGALPPGPVALGEGRRAADPNADVLDLWERMRPAKADGRISEAEAHADDLLRLLDGWEYPGLADTSDMADPFLDDPDEEALPGGNYCAPNNLPLGMEPALAL